MKLKEAIENFLKVQDRNIVDYPLAEEQPVLEMELTLAEAILFEEGLKYGVASCYEERPWDPEKNYSIKKGHKWPNDRIIRSEVLEFLLSETIFHQHLSNKKLTLSFCRIETNAQYQTAYRDKSVEFTMKTPSVKLDNLELNFDLIFSNCFLTSGITLCNGNYKKVEFTNCFIGGFMIDSTEISIKAHNSVFKELSVVSAANQIKRKDEDNNKIKITNDINIVSCSYEKGLTIAQADLHGQLECSLSEMKDVEIFNSNTKDLNLYSCSVGRLSTRSNITDGNFTCVLCEILGGIWIIESEFKNTGSSFSISGTEMSWLIIRQTILKGNIQIYKNKITQEFEVSRCRIHFHKNDEENQAIRFTSNKYLNISFDTNLIFGELNLSYGQIDGFFHFFRTSVINPQGRALNASNSNFMGPVKFYPEHDKKENTNNPTPEEWTSTVAHVLKLTQSTSIYTAEDIDNYSTLVGRTSLRNSTFSSELNLCGGIFLNTPNISDASDLNNSDNEDIKTCASLLRDCIEKDFNDLYIGDKKSKDSGEYLPALEMSNCNILLLVSTSFRNLFPDLIIIGSFNLENSRVDHWRLNPVMGTLPYTYWKIPGLTYSTLSVKDEFENTLDSCNWFSNDGAKQPYEQLAKSHFERGDDDRARKVLLNISSKRLEAPFTQVLKILAFFSIPVHRAFYSLIILFIMGYSGLWWLNQNGFIISNTLPGSAEATSVSGYSPFLHALELLFPVYSFDQGKFYRIEAFTSAIPSLGVDIILVVYQTLGLSLFALLIIGLGRIIRRRG